MLSISNLNKTHINLKLKYGFFFLLGILVGSLGSIFFSDLNFAPAQNESDNNQKIVSTKKEKLTSKLDKTSPKIVAEENGDKEAESQKIDTDTLKQWEDTSYYFEDTIASYSDSQYVNQVKDIEFDSLETNLDSVYVTEDEQQNLEIKRDELIATLEIVIETLKEAQKNVQTSDTALLKLADIKPNTKSKFLIVEFWESPINYKGYKFNGKRLVLFGFEYFENQTKIYKINNKFILQYLNKYYYLEESFDFKRYAQVNDSTLLFPLLKK